MATLVLLTESFPLGGLTEPGFVAPELDALCTEFDRVVIAPVIDRGVKDTPLPVNAEVDRTLLCRPGIADKLTTALRPATWSRINADGRFIHSRRQLVSALAFSAYVDFFRKKIVELIKRRNLDLDSTLFYTFWFDFQASALAGIPRARFISRAHRYDIYDSENPFISHSRRAETLAAMAACYPVSEHGREYLAADYPDHAAKIRTRRLGSEAPEGLNPPRSEGDADVAVVSIARIAPEKRVWLLAESLREWAGSRPDLSISWTHVGSGDKTRMDELKSSLPNLKIELTGALPNAEVHRLLAMRHFDFMAMLSSSEGLPIAACEAISHGVPVVAAAVGGLPEIVTPESGVLLSPDPMPREFAAAMDRALPSLAGLRVGARALWEREFDARPLRRGFAREIRKLVR